MDQLESDNIFFTMTLRFLELIRAVTGFDFLLALRAQAGYFLAFEPRANRIQPAFLHQSKHADIYQQ